MKVLAIVTLVFVLAVVAFRSWMPSCDGSSKAANYARSLPKERLRQLYLEMERYSQDERTPLAGWLALDGHSVPEPFRDLKVAKIRPREANIMLEGCVDEFIYLGFSGFGGKGPRVITLSFPSGAGTHGSEVLWKE